MEDVISEDGESKQEAVDALKKEYKEYKDELICRLVCLLFKHLFFAYFFFFFFFV